MMTWKSDIDQENPNSRFSVYNSSIKLGVLMGLILILASYLHKFYVAQVPTQLNEPYKTAPIYWFHDSKNEFEKFEEIGNALDKLGLQGITMNYTKDIRNFVHMDWDLAWSFQNIYEIPIDWKQLKYYQKVNHFPGTSAMLVKSKLATFKPSLHIPRGFLSNEELRTYAENNPNIRYLQKNVDNRGISIKNVSDITINIGSKVNPTFAQIYAEDPFLIEGHKFDISTYVVITSVNPLRVYYYETEAVIRICPLKYQANDTTNMDRHIISPSQLVCFEFPPLKKYCDKGYVCKQALARYLIEKGVDAEKVFRQIEDVLREIILEREHLIIEEIPRFGSKYSFFELIRVGMMLDQNLKLHVIEMNQVL